jgi:hypothetical protein
MSEDCVARFGGSRDVASSFLLPVTLKFDLSHGTSSGVYQSSRIDDGIIAGGIDHRLPIEWVSASSTLRQTFYTLRPTSQTVSKRSAA